MNLNPIAAALLPLGFGSALATLLRPLFCLSDLILNDSVMLRELIPMCGLQPIEIHSGGGSDR